MTGAPEIAVVLCSHDGAELLPTALAALAAQTLDPARYEVIVVDDGSTDATAEVAEAAGATVVRLPVSRGLNGARNAGIETARAHVVAFTDDDCEPEPAWLERLLEPFSNPTVDGAAGRIVEECTDAFLLGYLRTVRPLAPMGAELGGSRSPLARLALYARRMAGFGPELRAGEELYSLVGANMALRRPLLRELGGFDAAFRLGADEEELCLRAHARPGGARLLYAPDAVVHHHFRPRLRDGIRRARAYGAGHARVAATHPGPRLIVYPVPVLAGVSLLAGLVNRRARRAVLVLTPLAYPRFTQLAVARRSPVPLAYAALTLAEEVATMAGELAGRRAGALVGSSDGPGR